MRYFYSAYEAQAIIEAHASQKIGWKFYLGATIYVSLVMTILFTLAPSTAKTESRPAEANSQLVVSDAPINNQLSRFYQWAFNPTKKSVTKVKSVIGTTNIKTGASL